MCTMRTPSGSTRTSRSDAPAIPVSYAAPVRSGTTQSRALPLSASAVRVTSRALPSRVQSPDGECLGARGLEHFAGAAARGQDRPDSFPR